MLLVLVAALSVIITATLCKHRSYSKGYEVGYEECKRCTTIPDVVWDFNNVVHKGLCPSQGIEIFEKQHYGKNNKDIIPKFGIDIKYLSDGENPKNRGFEITSYYGRELNPPFGQGQYKDRKICIKPYGVSDGFHTFDELYFYREQYNAALVNTLVALKKTVDPESKLGIFLQDVDIIKSTRHFGGEKCYGGGWFIVMIKTPWGQISNHYKLEYWNDFNCRVANVSWKWDGHGMTEALQRLHRLGANLIQYSK